MKTNGSTMRALVTGGAGFIGSNLVGTLVGRGAHVTVLDSLLSGYALNLRPYPGVRFVQGDVRDPYALEEAMRGCDTVFHLAASVGNARSLEWPLEDATTNVTGTLQVLEACRARRVRKLVFASSAAVYGEMRTLPIREDHPCEPEAPYGASKLGAEKACLAYAKAHDLDAVCLRLFDVYGPGQRFDLYGGVVPTFVHRLLQGGALTVYGDGEATRDFVHVRDVVQACLRAALAPRAAGTYNIAGGRGTTIKRLASLLGRTLGVAPEIEHADARPGDVRHRLADTSAAGRAFGFEPRIGLEEGLVEYAAWAKIDLRTAVAV